LCHQISLVHAGSFLFLLSAVNFEEPLKPDGN
jgi:hypothetical protein